jgi:hypothetical protein
LVRDILHTDRVELLDELKRKMGKEFLVGGHVSLSTSPDGEFSKKLKIRRKQDAGDLAAGLWCFALVLCHQLLSGENRLSSHDAYWLGLVDEIVGA